MKKNSSTFIDNLSLPIHRWFRYTAGFSAEWVENEVSKRLTKTNKESFTVLDPFSGSGTTLLACDKLGVNSIGIEAHPFVAKIAYTKLLWETDTLKIKKFAEKVLEKAQSDLSLTDEYPAIVLKCYDDENLKKIDHLKKAILTCFDGSNESKLIRLAFVSILRCSSHAGTASWQYVLPNKTKAKVADAFSAFDNQINVMIDDITFAQQSHFEKKSKLYHHDARKKLPISDNSVDFIITSPPYANNYDYADATRLELSVLGEIKEWSDLQTIIRPGLVRSCTQMVSKNKKLTYDYIEDPALAVIHDELLDIVKKLDEEKENHGGKKNYHTMITLYFLDLAYIWRNLRSVCKDGAEVCFVVGDSAPYGIYVPVDEWLGKLAVSAGFKSYHFEKLRDRNIKWKNRKHRVPLKEGRLWVEG